LKLAPHHEKISQPVYKKLVLGSQQGFFVALFDITHWNEEKNTKKSIK